VSKNRVSIFDDPLEVDVSGFAPKKAPDQSQPSPEQIRAVAEATSFRSREPAKPKSKPLKRKQRRYRTGRNIQINIKASQEAVGVFYAISDQKGWVLGVTFELALEALQRELGTSTNRDGKTETSN